MSNWELGYNLTIYLIGIVLITGAIISFLTGESQNGWFMLIFSQLLFISRDIKEIRGELRRKSNDD